MVDAFAMSAGDWAFLVADTRSAGGLVLSCPQCRIRLWTRTPGPSGRARRHFTHDRMAPRSCTNITGEGESDAHREMKETVADAYRSVQGIEAEVEQTLSLDDGSSIRVDVLARRGGIPVSAAEVQLSFQPADEIKRRNSQRRYALGKHDGWARTTPWFCNRVNPAWYQVIPVLWTTADGQQITDGIYAPHPLGGGDLEQPVALDIDQAASALIAGTIVEVDDGETAYWVDRRSIARSGKARKGRLRYRKTIDTAPLRPCDREPVAASTFCETAPSSIFCPVDGCGLTVTDNSAYCWRHTKGWKR